MCRSLVSKPDYERPDPFLEMTLDQPSYFHRCIVHILSAVLLFGLRQYRETKNPTVVLVFLHDFVLSNSIAFHRIPLFAPHMRLWHFYRQPAGMRSRLYLSSLNGEDQVHGFRRLEADALDR
jgi:hypothetical protein